MLDDSALPTFHNLTMDICRQYVGIDRQFGLKEGRYRMSSSTD